METLLLVTGSLGLIVASILAVVAKRPPVNGRGYAATYDSSTVIHDGDAAITRLRFWYTDESGIRRLVATESDVGVDFHAGDTVEIVISPDNSRFVMLSPKVRFRTSISVMIVSACLIALGMVAHFL
jgi:hypothetical protein